MDIKKDLGKRIKNLRKKHKFTQEKFAEMIDIAPRTLYGIECGKNFVTAETLSKILSAFGISAKELFTFEHGQTKENMKKELIKAINEEKIDIELLYKFYESIM